MAKKNIETKNIETKNVNQDQELNNNSLHPAKINPININPINPNLIHANNTNNQVKSRRAPVLHSQLNNTQPIQNKFTLEVFLFEELCKQFTVDMWQRSKENPFLAEKKSAFQAIYNSNQKSGCKVEMQNETLKFVILAMDQQSIIALNKSVAAYQTALNKWQNVDANNKIANVTYSLTVDDLDDIKPILQALSGACTIEAFYIRDAIDANKTTNVSAEKIKEIKDQIQAEKLATLNQSNNQSNNEVNNAKKQRA